MIRQNKGYLFNPFYSGTDRDILPVFTFIKRSVFMTTGLAGTVICLVCLYLGMREVMNLGGFVASGGPYEIAHQAPDWIWIMPASIFGGMFFILLNFLNARKIGGIKILIFLWPALFLSLGYNFMEYAINPPGDHSKIVISWLICGIIFIGMGGIPLLVIIRSIIQHIRNRSTSEHSAFKEFYTGQNHPENGKYMNKKSVAVLVFLLTILGLAGGIFLGITLFKIISS